MPCNYLWCFAASVLLILLVALLTVPAEMVQVQDMVLDTVVRWSSCRRQGFDIPGSGYCCRDGSGTGDWLVTVAELV